MSRGYKKTYRKMKRVYKNVELERRPFPKPLLILIICAAAFVAAFFAVRALISYYESTKVTPMVQETASLTAGKTNPRICMLTPEGRRFNLMTGNKAEDFSKDERGSSLVPLSEDRKQRVFIGASTEDISSLSYQVRNSANGDLVEETTLQDIKAAEGGAEALIEFKDLMNEKREYNLQLRLEMNDGSVSLYNTTIELMGDVWAEEKLAYVEKLSGWLYDPSKGDEVYDAFLPLSDSDGTNFAKAGINSLTSLLMWEGLGAKPAETPVPTIVKVDEESTKITQSYPIELSSSENERIVVNEAFSVKMTNSGEVILENYDRDAYETLLNPSVREGALDLGFQAGEDISALSSEDGGYTAFINGGSLWTIKAGHDTQKSKFTKVFSLSSENGAVFDSSGEIKVNDEGDITGINPEYGINILSLDNEGNIKFTVYGTYPGGFRSGETGISVYSYNAGENGLTELLFIPETGEFEDLKKVSDESYLNDKGEFFIVREGKLLQMAEDGTVAREITDTKGDAAYSVSESGGAYAAEQKDNIVIYNCDSDSLKEISPAEGERLFLVGYTGEDLVYGVGNTENESPDGKIFMNEIRVIDRDGNEKISYKNEGVYYSDVAVYDNGVKYKEFSKEADGSFKEIKEGRIVAKDDAGDKKFSLVFETETGKRKQLKMVFEGHVNSDDGEPVVVESCRYTKVQYD